MKCPKCKMQIEEFIIDIDATCSATFDKNGKIEYEEDTLVNNASAGSDFMCPECNEVITLSEQEAVELLKKE